MQQSQTALISNCHIGAVLDQELYELHMTLFRGPVQWSRPVVGLGSYVSAGLSDPGTVRARDDPVRTPDAAQ
jgi:hypothetical protein